MFLNAKIIDRVPDPSPPAVKDLHETIRNVQTRRLNTGSSDNPMIHTASDKTAKVPSVYYYKGETGSAVSKLWPSHSLDGDVEMEAKNTQESTSLLVENSGGSSYSNDNYDEKSGAMMEKILEDAGDEGDGDGSVGGGVVAEDAGNGEAIGQQQAPKNNKNKRGKKNKNRDSITATSTK